MRLLAFGDVRERLAKKGYASHELVDENRRVLVSPGLGGAVITATTGGELGRSCGWTNEDFFEEGHDWSRFRNPGALDLVRIGPGGGRWSFYHEPGKTQTGETWRVNSSLNRLALEVDGNSSATSIRMKAFFGLENWSHTVFNFDLWREVRILSEAELSEMLGEEVSAVGFRTQEWIQNRGDKTWSHETGFLNIWVLSQFPQGQAGTIILPFKTGRPREFGPMPTTDLLGKLSGEQCRVDPRGHVFLRCDRSGEFSAKIGVSPERTTGWQGSYQRYEGADDLLFLVNMPAPVLGQENYLSNRWDPAADPRMGEACYCYTDRGENLGHGNFGELETCSPALECGPNDGPTPEGQAIHEQTVIVCQRTKPGDLEDVAKATLRVNLDQVPFCN